MATIEFHGADLVVYFDSNPANVAVDHYVVEYKCRTSTITHKVDQAAFQSETPSGRRSYQDTLTHAENNSAGLTRNVRVSVYAVSDAGRSEADTEDAQNSLPVLPLPPRITPTLTGVEIALPVPIDQDLEGYVAWVGDKPDFPMDASTERYKGRSNTFSIQLADDEPRYMRVAPYDAFGLDTFSAWEVQKIKRKSITDEVIGSAPWKQLPSIIGRELQKPINDIAAIQIDYASSLMKVTDALSTKNLVAVRELKTRVEENGSLVAEELLQLTSRLGKSESGLSEFRKAVADANYASVTSVDKMIAKYGEGVTAYQLAEKESYAADKSAFSKSLEEMGAKVVEEGKIREGKISELRNVILDENGNIRVEKISELGAKITEAVDGKMTQFEGVIKEVEKAYKDGDAIVAESVKTLSSSIIGPDGELPKVKAVIEQVQKTTTDNDSARAQDIKNVQSRLDNVGGASIEQAFKTVADKVDGVSSQYTLKVQTDQNGQKYVAGMGIAVENGISAVAFSTDSFRIITPGSTPRQLFYADENGVYMPNVTIDKLKAGAIDFEFLSRQSNLNAASGYQALPGGLMLMWGQYRAYIAEERSISVTFPTPFPNACLSFTATPYIAIASNARDLYIQVVGSAQQGSATVYTQGYKGTGVLDGFNWFAVGY